MHDFEGLYCRSVLKLWFLPWYSISLNSRKVTHLWIIFSGGVNHLWNSRDTNDALKLTQIKFVTLDICLMLKRNTGTDYFHQTTNSRNLCLSVSLFLTLMMCVVKCSVKFGAIWTRGAFNNNTIWINRETVAWCCAVGGVCSLPAVCRPSWPSSSMSSDNLQGQHHSAQSLSVSGFYIWRAVHLIDFTLCVCIIKRSVEFRAIIINFK